MPADRRAAGVDDHHSSDLREVRAQQDSALGPLLGGLLAVLMNLRAMLEDAITPGWVKRENACVYLVLARPQLDGASP